VTTTPVHAPPARLVQSELGATWQWAWAWAEPTNLFGEILFNFYPLAFPVNNSALIFLHSLLQVRTIFGS